MSTDVLRACARLVRALACVLLPSALSACEQQDLVAPRADAFVVHGVLDAGADDQYVILQRTAGNTPSQLGVSGATVRIITPGGKIMTATETRDSARVAPVFTPANRIAYRLRLSDFGERLMPGGEYSLRISVAGADDITGSTRIPLDSNRVTSAARIDSIAFDFQTFDIAWPHDRQTTKYQVSVTASIRDYVAFADSVHSIPANATVAFETYSYRTPLFSRGLRYDVTVLALDENYYRYYRPRTDLQSESTASGVQGALGVFGSVSRVLVRSVYIK